MDDIGDGASSFVRGSFALFMGNFASLIVMAAGSILVARMLSPSDYGLYGVSLVLPELFLLFSGWGIDAALTRFLARYKVEGKLGMIRVLERAALLFKFGVGGVLSLALFLSADFLAVVLLKRPGAGELVRLASLLVVFQSLYSTVASGLAGLERMNLRAAVSVLQAVVKGASSPLLVYLGFGVSGPLIGHLAGYVAASLLGIFLMISTVQVDRGVDEESLAIGDVLGMMLGFGVPLFLGGLVAGFAGRFQGFLLSWFVSDVDFGNYHVALNFTMLVGLVTGSLAVTLFPAFSRLSHALEPDEAREIFRGSVRYSTMFVVPMICLLVAVSEPMIFILYSSRYPQAPLLMSLLLVPTLLVGFGSLSIGSFFNSQGDTGVSLRVGLVSSAVSIIVSPALVWVWGVFGLAVSIIVSSVFGSVFGLYMFNKRYDFYPDLGHTMRTLLSSLVSAGLSFGVIRLLSGGGSFVSLLFGSGVFAVAYLFLAPVTGAVEERDIVNLDSMLRSLAVVYPFAHTLLGFERKIIRLIAGFKKDTRRFSSH